MILDIAVKEKLERCVGFFPEIGMECIRTFAGVKSTLLQPWTILERLPGDNLHNIMLGTGNNLYQAIYAVSFRSEKDMNVIASTSFDELVDAWGEFANNYCGMLMDKSLFTEAFGYLTQSTPQYSCGSVFYSKAYACYGALVTESNLEINMGFAIRKLLL